MRSGGHADGAGEGFELPRADRQSATIGAASRFMRMQYKDIQSKSMP